MVKRYNKAEYFTAALLTVLLFASAISPLANKSSPSDEEPVGVFAPQSEVRITSPERRLLGSLEGAALFEAGCIEFRHFEFDRLNFGLLHQFVLPLILIIVGYILSADGKKRIACMH